MVAVAVDPSLNVYVMVSTAAPTPPVELYVKVCVLASNMRLPTGEGPNDIETMFRCWRSFAVSALAENVATVFDEITSLSFTAAFAPVTLIVAVALDVSDPPFATPSPSTRV